MHRYLIAAILALFIAFGGLSLTASTAEADCGKCAAGKAKICDKCKKAGKKTCDCKQKHKVCAKCKKAGKKVCGCKHKH